MRVWTFVPETLMGQMCLRITRYLSDKEWAEFQVADEPNRRPAPVTTDPTNTSRVVQVLRLRDRLVAWTDATVALVLLRRRRSVAGAALILPSHHRFLEPEWRSGRRELRRFFARFGRPGTGKIQEALRDCDAGVVVMGPRWYGSADLGRASRLHQPDDVVRLELEALLNARKAIFPILVEGARRPETVDLPENLTAFSRIQATAMDNAHCQETTATLIRRSRAGPSPRAIGMRYRCAVSNRTAITKDELAAVAGFAEGRSATD